MGKNKKFFRNKKNISVDEFYQNVLYKKRDGYYTSKSPFGANGDFITAPGVSYLFSEIIAIWLISTWYKLGKPKKINFVELGPGDGNLTKTLIKTLQNFPVFEKSIDIFLYEKSDSLKRLQKKNIKSKKVKWISSFTKIKNGPVIFFGNEFFDAIPIKQFIKINNK